jgi:hypothetical protein
MTIGVIARHATRKSRRQTGFPNLRDFVLSLRPSHPARVTKSKKGDGRAMTLGRL